jgi:catechol 2,3-dioxygenase-like lactoylglutathione lyase family enzyme
MESSTELKTRPFTKVDTVIVRVPDLEKARKWYEEKLGLQPAVTSEKERLVIFKTGGETSFTVYELKPGEEKTTGKTLPAIPFSTPRTSTLPTNTSPNAG